MVLRIALALLPMVLSKLNYWAGDMSVSTNDFAVVSDFFTFQW